jgi:hypothetical protein
VFACKAEYPTDALKIPVVKDFKLSNPSEVLLNAVVMALPDALPEKYIVTVELIIYITFWGGILSIC